MPSNINVPGSWAFKLVPGLAQLHSFLRLLYSQWDLHPKLPELAGLWTWTEPNHLLSLFSWQLADIRSWNFVVMITWVNSYNKSPWIYISECSDFHMRVCCELSLWDGSLVWIGAEQYGRRNWDICLLFEESCLTILNFILKDNKLLVLLHVFVNFLNWCPCQ